MKVYHGAIMALPHPDTSHSRRFLDFGKGFYTTTCADQAEKWALRKCLRSRNAGKAIVNVYEFVEKDPEIRIRRFDTEEKEWLTFVCACRKGEEPDPVSDIIIGPVADDDVFKTVDMYYKGLWDMDRTIEELRFYRKNDQIVFKNDEAVRRTLRFAEAYEVNK